MNKLLTSLLLSVLLTVSSGFGQADFSGNIVSVDDVAALLVQAESEEDLTDVIEAAREAGLSDIQIATAFGLALESLLNEGPSHYLPNLVNVLEIFVEESSESLTTISSAFESGQNLAQTRAQAGDPRVSPPDWLSVRRSPESSLEASPVGGGASAEGATGGGGGGVVSGGASPS